MELLAIQSFLLHILLVVAETFSSSGASGRSGWIPIPTIKPTPTASTAPPTVTPTPTPFQSATTNLVNSLRASYQAQPVTWNSTLGSEAQLCADRQVVVDGYMTILPCDCGGAGTAATVGFSDNTVASQGAREIISDPSWPANATNATILQQLGWYATFNAVDDQGTDCLNFNASPLMPNPLCSYFTQLIWLATTQLGCGYSSGNTTTDSLHALVCCWNPAGNDNATFAANVMNATARFL